MKIKYILAIHSDAPNESRYKIWLPANNSIFNLNSHDIICSVQGTADIIECDVLCDVNTHEKCVEIEKLGTRNPLELTMKLDLYPNLYLEI
jgi:hypothetical protein